MIVTFFEEYFNIYFQFTPAHKLCLATLPAAELSTLVLKYSSIIKAIIYVTQTSHLDSGTAVAMLVSVSLVLLAYEFCMFNTVFQKSRLMMFSEAGTSFGLFQGSSRLNPAYQSC